MCNLVHAFSRKSKNHIHIDIIKSGFSCHRISIFNILNCMLSTNQVKCFLVHCLRINRYSSDIMCF